MLEQHQNSVFVHLDEKWFYTTSRRKQYKYLPLGNHEDPGTDRIHPRRVIHKSHPAKCMFMAVVTKANEQQGFSGTIMMKRVSATRIKIRTSSNQQFSISRSINNQLKEGDWHQLLPAEHYDNYTMFEIKTLIIDFYELDDDIYNQLEI